MIIGELTGLRALEKEDLPLLRDWRNTQSFRRNFREVRELNLFNQENWFTRTYSSANDFMFMIEDIRTREAIGAAGLLYTNWIIRAADFSFYIGKDNRYIDDAGFAFDAAKSLITYGFNNLNLNKIWMELYEYDTAKIDFFTEKFNFKIDGQLRQNCFEDGRFWDSYIVSLLAEDFKAAKNS